MGGPVEDPATARAPAARRRRRCALGRPSARASLMSRTGDLSPSHETHRAVRQWQQPLGRDGSRLADRRGRGFRAEARFPSAPPLARHAPAPRRCGAGRHLRCAGPYLHRPVATRRSIWRVCDRWRCPRGRCADDRPDESLRLSHRPLAGAPTRARRRLRERYRVECPQSLGASPRCRRVVDGPSGARRVHHGGLPVDSALLSIAVGYARREFVRHAITRSGTA